MLAKPRADFAALFLSVACLGAPAWAGAVKAPPVQVKVLAATKAPLSPSAIPVPSLIPAAPRLFDNGGGEGEGPDDPPGGGEPFPARATGPERRRRPILRTREQLASHFLVLADDLSKRNFIDKEYVEPAIIAVVHDVSNTLMFEGFSEEEIIQAFVQVMKEQPLGAHRGVGEVFRPDKSFLVFLSKLQQPNSLPVWIKAQIRSRLIRQRIRQSFGRIPFFEKQASATPWVEARRDQFLSLHPLAQEELRRIFEARERVLPRIIQEPMFGQSSAPRYFLRPTVRGIVGGGIDESFVLDVLDRLFQKWSSDDLTDEYGILNQEVMREHVLQLLAPRFGRGRILGWFRRHGSDHILEAEVIENLLNSLEPRKIRRQ